MPEERQPVELRGPEHDVVVGRERPGVHPRLVALGSHRLDEGATALGEVMNQVHAAIRGAPARPFAEVHHRAGRGVRRAVGVHLDLTVADANRECWQRVDRVEGRDAGAQVEVPGVERADCLTVLDVPVADLASAVGAEVAKPEHGVAVAHEGHLRAVHDPHGAAARLDVVEAADRGPSGSLMPFAHRHPVPASALTLDVCHPRSSVGLVALPSREWPRALQPRSEGEAVHEPGGLACALAGGALLALHESGGPGCDPARDVRVSRAE